MHASCRLTLSFGAIGALTVFVANCGNGTNMADFDSRSSAAAATVSVSVTPATAAVLEGQTLQFKASVIGTGNSAVTWAVNGIPGGNPTVGTVDSSGLYTAPTGGNAQVVTVQATSTSDPSDSGSASVAVVPPGQVSATNNPQVAEYSITPPLDATVTVQFGPDTSYGLQTWSRPSPAGGGPVQILVAGMRANSTYHLRARVDFLDGAQLLDSDHPFTTGGLPPQRVPSITVTQPNGPTPNRGVELLDLVSNASGSGTSNQVQVAAVDLQGNLVWYYDDPQLPAGLVPNPVKLLPNGNLLVNFSSATGGTDGTDSVLREVDLAGNTVWQLTANDLDQRLVDAFLNVIPVGTHHDFVSLPNGHLILIAAITQTFTDLVGSPGSTTVTGDLLVDLDPAGRPVWVWNAFDHLDVNRHPMGFPDWTHTNAVLYSPSDGNLLISMRHQNWIIKIDYRDGKGSGNVLWRLGEGGDFTLEGGTDPMDWFYAQHAPILLTSEAGGVFKLAVFDNGNDRLVDSAGDLCGSSVACYSRVPIFQVDENAKTATLVWQDPLPFFSVFGGYVQQFPNQNIEFDASASSSNPPAATIEEVTDSPAPELVLEMTINGQYAYRAFRIPSLYPGVQW